MYCSIVVFAISSCCFEVSTILIHLHCLSSLSYVNEYLVVLSVVFPHIYNNENICKYALSSVCGVFAALLFTF